jgi:hypothetical protein
MGADLRARSVWASIAPGRTRDASVTRHVMAGAQGSPLNGDRGGARAKAGPPPEPGAPGPPAGAVSQFPSPPGPCGAQWGPPPHAPPPR